MQPQFPFNAVIAQEPLKLALLLNVVEPKLGGVLISGARGSGKSTLARGLTDIAGFSSEQFVNLPLGASEEQLTGALHLEKALASGEVTFNPGLLARAHEGVLYVDEVNLLPDALVDLLLDVSASGVNHVERDGISHRHAARFLLVGTMNPDEGELRPQLLDRFPLCVHLDAQLTPQERVQAVQNRLAFDADPAAFCAHYEPSQQALRQRLHAARERLQDVQLAEQEQLLIAERCAEAGVEGLRADICLQRASRAYAAWMGAQHVDETAIDAVSELVLSHRRQPASSSAQPSQSPAMNDKPETEPPGAEQQQDTPAEPSQRHQPLDASRSGQSMGAWGEMPAATVGFSQSTPQLQPFRVTSHTTKKKR